MMRCQAHALTPAGGSPKRPGSPTAPARRRLHTALALLLLTTGLLTTGLLTTGLLTTDVSAAEGQTGGGGAGQGYALLFGSNSYSEWSPLINPIPDVKALGRLLANRYGFYVEVIENPTREEILAKLRRYADREYAPGDQLVVAFAGHGTYDELTRIGYLAPTDAQARRRDPNFNSLLSYPLLTALLDNLPCRQVILIVDACYAGLLRRGADAGGDTTGSGRLRRYLTSGSVEYVGDGNRGEHTPFVRQLLAGLSTTGSGGRIAWSALAGSFGQTVDPPPRSGAFGSDPGRAELYLAAAGGGRMSTSSPSTATDTASAPAVHAPPVDDSALRGRPARLTEQSLERTFRVKGLFDLAWSPEGDFPNQLRQDRKGLWEVVTDLESGLMWQLAGSDSRMTQFDATAYVRQLNSDRHAGFSDWRLPTVEELASLLEPFQQADGLYIDPTFSPEQETCWSADRDRQTGDGYYVSYLAGRTVLGYGNRTAFVRAVRRP